MELHNYSRDSFMWVTETWTGPLKMLWKIRVS